MSIEAPRSCWMYNELQEFMFCQMTIKTEKVNICSNKCFLMYKLSEERANAFNLAVLQSPPMASRVTIGAIKKSKSIPIPCTPRPAHKAKENK